MRIHHMNCGSMCPVGVRRTPSSSGLGERAKVVCHCLAIETAGGVVLVDTGLGMGDVERHERLPLSARLLLRTRLNPRETAVRRLATLGIGSRDVRHILLSHLDFDHAGGIEDFPEAAVHVAAVELETARGQQTMKDRLRYRPSQWNNHVVWRPFAAVGERWYGFDCVRDVPGLPPEILLVPLPGHSPGHCGVAVRGDDGWLFHAADAYFHHDEIHGASGDCPPGLRAYQTFMETDRQARLHNRERLRQLVREHTDVRVICSHDVSELEQLVPYPRDVRRSRTTTDQSSVASL